MAFRTNEDGRADIVAVAERRECTDSIALVDCTTWTLLRVRRRWRGLGMSERAGSTPLTYTPVAIVATRRAASGARARQRIPVKTRDLESLDWTPNGRALVVADTAFEVLAAVLAYGDGRRGSRARPAVD